MTKTLTVSIEDTENINHLSISGTRKDDFNPDVVLSVGSIKIVLDSKCLAEALAAVVDFVTPPVKKELPVNKTMEFLDGEAKIHNNAMHNLTPTRFF